MSDCCDCFDPTFEEGTEFGFDMWQGLAGPHFTPAVDAEGNLSWTNNGQLKNPATVNIKGPAGESFVITDTVNSVSALPIAPEIGTAYGVGTEPPYDVYVFGESGWTNYGPLISVAGPQGPPGEDGEKGDKGDTGPQGPPGADAVITPESVESGLGYNPGMVNPNLLDNWYFGYPVNQRGRTEYQIRSSIAAYTVDRWKARNGNCNVVIANDGLSISNVSETYSSYFQQDLETPVLAGACSVLAAEVVGSAYLQILYEDSTLSNAKRLVNGLNTIISSSKKIKRVFAQVNVGASVKLIAAKLELGPVQTLARQVNGEWVLNEIPDYGEQLARCQRYFRRFSANNINTYPGHITGTNRLTFLVGYAPFRTTPACAMSDDFALTVRLASGGYSPVTGISGTKPSKVVNSYLVSSTVTVYFEFSEAPGTNNLPVTSSIAAGYVDLSADL